MTANGEKYLIDIEISRARLEDSTVRLHPRGRFRPRMPSFELLVELVRIAKRVHNARLKERASCDLPASEDTPYRRGASWFQIR